MITIDGSLGEGGGQILRSALALSILTGKPFKIIDIRANRKPPGLRPQHAMSVRAAAQICGADIKGASVGSSTLTFEPGPVIPGNYNFSIGTAGATGLVLQTIYLPLALGTTSPSTITITGGTHVSTSPCYHYLATTWVGYLKKMGLAIDLTMERPGFYPRGGGTIRARIDPCPAIQGLTILSCPAITTASGISAVAGLPESIATRQQRRMTTKLRDAGIEPMITEETWDGGPGTMAAIIATQSPIPTLFFSVGEKGKPAEAVADDALSAALAYRDAGAPVDPHAADQILLPLAFADSGSEYRTGEITRHLTTNREIIGRFLDREITIEGQEGEPGTVRIGPREV